MKVAALFSGGKDSTFSYLISKLHGFEILFFIFVFVEDRFDDVYHLQKKEVVEEISKKLGKKLYVVKKEELLGFLKEKKEEGLEGIFVGGLESNYQRFYFNSICEKADLRCFSPLWKKREKIIEEEVNSGISFFIVETKAENFEEWLGKEVSKENFKDYLDFCRKHNIDPSLEGGDGETIVSKVERISFDWDLECFRKKGFCVVKKRKKRS